MSVACGRKTLCLTHYNGKFAALDNACPHQGGPLGEGSIENGYLRCPWHGWDFDPLTGRSPGEYDDGVATYPLQVRDDGIFVEIDEEDQYVPTVSDLMCETMVNWGVKHVWGMVGHSNLGLADAIRRQTEKRKLLTMASATKHLLPLLVLLMASSLGVLQHVWQLRVPARPTY